MTEQEQLIAFANEVALLRVQNEQLRRERAEAQEQIELLIRQRDEALLYNAEKRDALAGENKRLRQALEDLLDHHSRIAGDFDTPAKRNARAALEKMETQGEVYVPEAVASDITGFEPKSLRNMRHRGGGPEFVKMGRAVRYPVSKLHAWMAARIVSPAKKEEHK